MDVSVIVPLYNEEDNVEHLYQAIEPVMRGLQKEWELVLVNDGSSDGTATALEDLASRDPHVKIIEFRRNFGQTAAMSAGIQHACGDIIITMDGDLQNDPTDIPMMLAKLSEGYDLVHGWRKNRQDALLHRKIPSRLANGLISWVTKFPVHDLGCTLKAIRREIAQELQLYGEMHRFIPILAHCRGARCAEVVTNHHARQYGISKYGLTRVPRVVLDLMTVKYLIQYMVSPMKLFGGIGLICTAVGMAAGSATLGMKIAYGTDMTGNPLLLLTLFSGMVGVQFFVLGMLGELCARIYYQVSNREAYAIRKTINLSLESDEMTHLQLKRQAA